MVHTQWRAWISPIEHGWIDEAQYDNGQLALLFMHRQQSLGNHLEAHMPARPSRAPSSGRRCQTCLHMMLSALQASSSKQCKSTSWRRHCSVLSMCALCVGPALLFLQAECHQGQTLLIAHDGEMIPLCEQHRALSSLAAVRYDRGATTGLQLVKQVSIRDDGVHQAHERQCLA